MTSTDRKRSILITGGAGFIGGNFVPYFLEVNPQYKVVNLDKLTYAGTLTNLQEIEDHNRYTFVHGDICDRKLLKEIFVEHQIWGVIHFAAESHVDNSIDSPAEFIKTNIEGTFALLETARDFWNATKGSSPQPRFHHISTDEVYGSLGSTGYFTEKTAYAPNSPYSASKAAADFLVRSYHKTYGLNTVTSNCSNNYGPKQHDEKLIPTIIRTALKEQDIPIYGKGENIRDWLFVQDHCRAIDKVFWMGQSGETYLVGGDNEFSNLYIAQKICEILDKIKARTSGNYADLIRFVEDRPGHDFRYAIKASKIENELDWKSETDFEHGLEKTVAWYIDKYGD